MIIKKILEVINISVSNATHAVQGTSIYISQQLRDSAAACFLLFFLFLGGKTIYLIIWIIFKIFIIVNFYFSLFIYLFIYFNNICTLPIICVGPLQSWAIRSIMLTGPAHQSWFRSSVASQLGQLL